MPYNNKLRRFTFKKHQKRQLHAALQRYLSIHSKVVRTAIIREIETTGILRVFAFGSLIKTPHTEAAMHRYDGVLKGYSAGFECFDIFYRGTKDKPALTLGLKKDSEGKTQGVVLEQILIQDEKLCPFNQIIRSIIDFGKRENPQNMPIYKFRLVDVFCEAAGQPVKAVACVADQRAVSPDNQMKLYVGDALDIDAKARMIASASGGIRIDEETRDPLNHRAGRRTSYQYLVDFIDARLKRGFEIEDELYQLLYKANEYRQQMSKMKRSFMEEMEDLANIDMRAFLVQKVPLKARAPTSRHH
jgi:hypothetical protein